jgi:hypothetical protein
MKTHKMKDKYILIDCDVKLYELAYELCKILKKYGFWFSVNFTTNENQFDTKSVSEGEFNKTFKQQEQ